MALVILMMFSSVLSSMCDSTKIQGKVLLGLICPILNTCNLMFLSDIVYRVLLINVLEILNTIKYKKSIKIEEVSL